MANKNGQPPKKAFEIAARKPFAAKLTAARVMAGKESKADGARALGVEVGTYESWEKGRTEPSIYWLARISFVFEISLDALIPPYRPAVSSSASSKAKGAGRGNTARRPFSA